MHPPNWVVDSIVNLHPQKMLRLGWVGDTEDLEEDQAKELNRGSFVLLQLYHKRDVARIPTVYPWKMFPNRGSVFGPGWDPLVREPVALAYFSKMDVCQGRIIPIVKRWMRPMKERFLEGAKERAATAKSMMNDAVGTSAERLYYHAQKSVHKPNIVAKKFLTEREKKVLSGEASAEKDTDNMFLPEWAQSA